MLRINLNKSNQLIGICSQRGTRKSNEDQYAAVSLELPEGNNLLKMNKNAERAYVGVFDG
jgi:serine/threonine protein phosphatase PrpC